MAFLPDSNKLRTYYNCLQIKFYGPKTLKDQAKLVQFIQDFRNNKDLYGELYSEKDLLFFQEYTESKVDDEGNAVGGQELCFAYQSSDMLQNLITYGQDIACLDATYKTTQVQNFLLHIYAAFFECFQFFGP